MEGAAPDGNRGPNRGRPRRCAPLPPPTAAPGPPFPQALAKRLPAPRRARPPPPTLAVSHTFHSPGDDESYTLIGKNRTPLGWVTFQPLAWVSFRALPAGPFEGLGPDIVEGIRRIKSQDGPDLILSGSSTLTSTLFEHGLADEVLLVVYPVLLGTGKRFFAEGTPPRSFELVSTKAMPSGIILSIYKAAGPLKAG